MTPQEQQLVEQFPLTLSELGSASAHSSLAAYGIECGPGWRRLLIALFETLETEISKLPEDERPHARQIKEKFGELRVYLSLGGTSIMRDAIAIAEATSTSICEVCSEPGRIRRSDSGWLATRCDSHVHTRVDRY